MVENKVLRFHLSETLGKKSIFFPDSYKLFEINEKVYEILEEYKETNNIDILPEKIKDFLESNKCEKLEVEKDKEINHETLTLNVAQSCNMKCVYCFGDEGTYGNEALMDLETAITAIEKVFNGNLKDKNINFFGGEPLLNYKVIVEIVEYIKKNFNELPKLHITTNGTLITGEIADFLKDNNISVCVSLDGQEEKHNTARPLKNKENSFEKTINGIKVCREKGIELRVRGTLSALNLPDESETEVLKFIEFYNVGTEKEELNPCIEEYEKFLKTAFIKALETGDDNYIPRGMKAIYKNINEKALLSLYCEPGIKAITVSPGGDAYYCYRLSGIEDFKVGNIHKDSMEEIKNKIMEKYETYHNCTDNEEKCVECWARYICGGGCLHERYISKNFKSIDKDIFCKYNKKIIEYSFGLLLSRM